MEYGPAAGYGHVTALNSSLQTSHSQALSGLDAGTVYHYRVRSKDAAGNEAVSGDNTFTTSEAADTTPPVISAVESSGITENGATISWTTNEASTSQVEYGPTAGYGHATALNSSLETSHSQALDGLTIGTLYHYRVKSMDTAGNLAVSGDYTFSTSSDSTPPTIGSVVVSEQTGTQVTINWSTNEASDSQIEYGTTTVYDSVTALDPLLQMSHVQIIDDLAEGDVYHFRVLSRDEAGNMGVSEDYTFVAMNVATTMTVPLFSEGLVSNNDEVYVGMSLMNMGDVSSHVALTAFDDKGNMIAGGGIANPVVRQIHPGQQLSLVDAELFGDLLSRHCSNGWIRLESTNKNVRGFFLMFDGQTHLIDGAGFLPGPFRNFVFTDIKSNGGTKFSLINKNSEAAIVKIDLVNADGQVRDSITETISGYGSMTANLNAGLFGGTSPDDSDYISVAASESIEAFQLVQQGWGGDVSLIAAQDINSAAPVLISPQYIYRKDYKTGISIVNSDPVAGNVQIRFRGKDGVQIGATRNISVNAYGKISIDDPEFFLDQGLLETQISDVLSAGVDSISGKLTGKPNGPNKKNTSALSFDGYLEIVSNNVRLVGSASYQGRNNNSFIASFPLVSELQEALVFNQVSSDEIYYTQIALANTGNSDAVVTLDLYNNAGEPVSTATVTIPAGQSQCHSLTEYFNATQGLNVRGGFLTLSSNHPIAANSFLGTHDQAVLSAIPGQVVE